MNNVIMQFPKRSFFLSFLSLLLLLGFSSSCNTNKNVTKAKVDKKLTAEDLLAQMKRDQIQAEWMQAKAKLSYDGEDMKVSGSASIKWRKDSLIWMSVRKFGLEVVRTQITKDSIYVLDRLNNEYTVEPLSYIEQRFKLPARFDLIQSVFLGNPIFFSTNLSLATSEEAYHLTGESGSGMQNDYWLNLVDRRLNKMAFEEEAANRTLAMSLNDYQSTDNGYDFSYLRQVDINSRETGKATVTLEFKEVILDVPTEFKFSVPARYSR